MATNPSGYLTSSDLNGYASEQYVQDYTSGFVDSAYVTDYVTSQTSGKQDELTFTYDSSDKISAINGSALAGEGGSDVFYAECKSNGQNHTPFADILAAYKAGKTVLLRVIESRAPGGNRDMIGHLVWIFDPAEGRTGFALFNVEYADNAYQGNASNPGKNRTNYYKFNSDNSYRVYRETAIDAGYSSTVGSILTLTDNGDWPAATWKVPSYAEASALSGKQDTLTFGYTDDKISSINSSAIYSTGGGGGTTYSAGQGIDIASNTISLKYDTEGLLTTENLLSTSYPDTVFAEVDHFKQNGTFHNLWSISNYMVDDRTYTVKLAAHHNADYQQGDGYAVSKSSTSMTWNTMLLMIGYMWNNDGYIDLSQGWDYEDGAEEERWEYNNISNCQLQITDDVTGDVYYSDDFSSNELWAFGASDGKLKLKIDKGYEGAILLWNETEQKWYADRLPEIPETISHRVLIANGSNNTADWTSNTITVTPASHSENWNGNLDIQNFDLTNTFKMLCSCSFVGDIQATSNATTTGTVVVKNRDGETLSLQVNVRQISNYSSANDLTTVQFVTDEYSIPFEATLYGEDAANYGYLYSVSFTFDGLQSGGTALSPEDYGMYVITNTWHV
jgi:hypothetical protein